ncbi:hypothetical protein Csa_001177 [Cucumis sativus]|uniref:Uncharacterized protein n=1 Tax=Cucumis sativus TaxID=3659 RepID=A0A0A0LKB7_CUCSA|nr:hypothetical protein Csa_001177 [Cucumis sativus]
MEYGIGRRIKTRNDDESGSGVPICLGEEGLIYLFLHGVKSRHVAVFYHGNPKATEGAEEVHTCKEKAKSKMHCVISAR